LTYTTADQLKKVLRFKVKATKTGFEATVKGDSPEEAVSLAVKADAAMMAYKTNGYTPPADKPRGEHPPVLLDSAYMMAAGGATGGYNAHLQALSEDYTVKIDLIRNTKGLGWEITVKATGSTEDEVIANSMALLAETDERLRTLFPEAAPVAS
jgi:hypothetical protein